MTLPPLQPRGSLVTRPSLLAHAARAIRLPRKITATVSYPPFRPLLDQGQTPRCGGYGSANWLNMRPRQQACTAADADAIYLKARDKDARNRGDDTAGVFPGDLLEALKQLGYTASKYPPTLWTERDIREHLLTVGPVMVSMPIYEGMYWPDDSGIAHIRKADIKRLCRWGMQGVAAEKVK